MAQIIPFGKYKNQSCEVLAQDPAYCEWLLGQGWVAERFPEIHTLIINNFAEPADTPAHNALQLQFLDPTLVVALTALLVDFHRPYKHHFKSERYAPLLSGVGMPVFEQHGIDVSWFATVLWPQYVSSSWTYSGKVYPPSFEWQEAGIAVIVECKPSLGDDYPAALRFLHSHLGKQRTAGPPLFPAVVAEQYTFRGGSRAQVQQLFQASGVLLTLIDELRAMPAVELYHDTAKLNPEYFSDKGADDAIPF
jgi:hypothetical protein